MERDDERIHMPGKIPANSDSKRKHVLWKKIVDHIASESKAHTSNGNRTDGDDAKGGGAERGGPDLDKADDRQPPDSFRRPSEEP